MRCRRVPERSLPELAGVVLAGGRSTRFGRNKLAEPYRDAPVLHHPVLRLAELCGEVVVVLAPDADEPSMPMGVQVRFARDAVEGHGPLAGLVAGLGAVTGEHALVAAGDMPDLQTRVLLEMVRVAARAGSETVALRDGDDVRPLPCVVRTRRAIDIVHGLLHDGRAALRDLLDASRTAVIDEATWRALDPDGRTLIDVDEPSDLER